jgi:hypothetical protein
VIARLRCASGVVGSGWGLKRKTQRVTKPFLSRIVLERLTAGGDSPVGEKKWPLLIRYLSTTGHEESCGNPGRPFSKAKYSLMTDSEPVPRGKGEKNPC